MAFLVAKDGNQEIVINDDTLNLSDLFDPSPASPSVNVSAYVAAGAVEISNNAVASTLLDAGVTGSSLVIAANTWLVGETYRGTCGGKWGSKALTAGKLKWNLLLGTELDAQFEPTLPDGQVDQSWHMEFNLTRRSLGSSGVVAGQIRFWAENIGGPFFFNVPGLVISSTASKTFDLKGDFVTADPANKVSQQYFFLVKTGAPV